MNSMESVEWHDTCEAGKISAVSKRSPKRQPQTSQSVICQSMTGKKQGGSTIRNWRLSTKTLIRTAGSSIITAFGFLFWMLIAVLFGSSPSERQFTSHLAAWLCCFPVLLPLSCFIIAHRCGTNLGNQIKSTRSPYLVSAGILFVPNAMLLIILHPIEQLWPLPAPIRGVLILL